MHPTTAELFTETIEKTGHWLTLILRQLLTLGVVVVALDGCEKPNPRPGRPIAAHAAAGITRANQMSMPTSTRTSYR